MMMMMVMMMIMMITWSGSFPQEDPRLVGERPRPPLPGPAGGSRSSGGQD